MMVGDDDVVYNELTMKSTVLLQSKWSAHTNGQHAWSTHIINPHGQQAWSTHTTHVAPAISALPKHVS